MRLMFPSLLAGFTLVALHGCKRDREGEAFVQDTEKLFKATERWNEQALNVLANLCVRCSYTRGRSSCSRS